MDLTDLDRSLQQRIGYRFKDSMLLLEALTHKSFANEAAGHVPFNERLEFLGDAVLDLVVSDILFTQYPDLAEGELTRIRSEVVSEKALAQLAASLDIGACLRLGRGEERTGGRKKESLLADSLEALLGAVYCDGGLPKVRACVESAFMDGIRSSYQRKAGTDYKTRLQELLQRRHGQLPTYVLLSSEGPDHRRTYLVEVRFDGAALGEGRGRSKKIAEQEAAHRALESLGA